MQAMAASHRLVRVISCVLGFGGLAGVVDTLFAAAQPGWVTHVIVGMIALLYAGIAVAAWALWRGHRLGLHWTRLLLLLQVPFVQSTWFSYWLFAGAGLRLFAGSNWGVAFNLGAEFQWTMRPGGGPEGLSLGANVLALAAFLALGRVAPGRPVPGPPMLPRDAPESAE